ncbi:GNAT family N-acetyltransferase [Halobacillus andaensis]|uniref:GNAT family N-acetyltransferase n=1 Tax=Halobacillus andaensis TaxID=1176239 RepID=UPI003D759339
MNYRVLTGQDAKAYRELRLEALLTNPDAFLTTYEQEKQRPNPIEFTAKRLESPHTKTAGAFYNDQLAGVATLIQETHPKYLHKGSIAGVYVTPSHRQKGDGDPAHGRNHPYGCLSSNRSPAPCCCNG